MVQDLEDRNFKVPNRVTLMRGARKLDVAMMHFSRDANKPWPRGQVARYLIPDGSPQGRELNLMEIFEKSGYGWINIVKRIAPLMTLDHAHIGTMDRGMACMHASFLLSGPTQQQMREYGESFGAVIGDLGEVTIPDIPDLTTVYLRGDTPENLLACKGTYFFKYALSITGPSHLLDWVLYATLIRSAFISGILSAPITSRPQFPSPLLIPEDIFHLFFCTHPIGLKVFQNW